MKINVPSLFLPIGLMATVLGWQPASSSAAERRPNVIVILTDDQGFGELGVTGNPAVRTPNIDRFARQSVSLTNFNVMPVCSPTRASLMTGRDYYRTGITDTWLGSSLMDPREVTVAEMFASGGYRTGIFGKWHLGDNYPRRPEDRGFQESLVLNGGGLAQPGDPPDAADERGAYFNATLRHNGRWTKTKGYIGDVVTDAAMEFIETNRDRPFFAYLAFNLPHSPHQVPDRYREHYPSGAFDPAHFPREGHPMAAQQNAGVLSRVYGMIENIDENVSRLLAKLDALKLADNTIVVLFSDNGCQRHNGYNAGLRGWKGTTWEGGIHQFCFVRWPGRLDGGRKVDQVSSVIDVCPTLLELCGLQKPERVSFDGRSLARLLRGDARGWTDRALFFQWHRGAAPERYRGMAVRTQNWKLVQPSGGGEGDGSGRKPAFQLFDMAHDALEMHDVAAEHPEQVAMLKEAYDAWFDGLARTRDYNVPQRIHVGAREENPVLLTRQDWRGPQANWSGKGVGYWELKVVSAAHYEIKVRVDPAQLDRRAVVKVAAVSIEETIPAGEEGCTFRKVPLPLGDARLEVEVRNGAETIGAKYVEVARSME